MGKYFLRSHVLLKKKVIVKCLTYEVLVSHLLFLLTGPQNESVRTHCWIYYILTERYRRIKPELPWIFPSCWLIFIMLEDALQDVGKGGYQWSYPTVNPMNYTTEKLCPFAQQCKWLFAFIQLPNMTIIKLPNFSLIGFRWHFDGMSF